MDWILDRLLPDPDFRTRYTRRIDGPPEAAGADGFTAFSDPGWAKAAMGLQVIPSNGRTILAADTRVTATDRRSRRVFSFYWSLIRLGGAGLIRLELLTAPARLAERRA
ncbi:hypothetical protein [Actinomadura oligospora]|uniref:hypothetical protein n=1 Tax=Actinomadura oligospora TaxID=111804 RepID=UPI00047E3B60|nr:hypothetical protein [Actinomadura oligospora]